MPSIAQIRAATDPTAAVEVCNLGANAVAIAISGKAPSSPLEKFGSPHCGYCASGIAFATPPALLPQIVIADTPSSAAHLASIPNLKSQPRLAAFSRGPPTHLT